MPRYRALAAAWRATPPLPRLLATLLLPHAAGQTPRGDLAAFVQAMTGARPPD